MPLVGNKDVDMPKKDKAVNWCKKHGIDSLFDLAVVISEFTGESCGVVDARIESICSGKSNLKKGFKEEIDGALAGCKISEPEVDQLIAILRKERERPAQEGTIQGPVGDAPTQEGAVKLVLRRSVKVKGTCEVEFIYPGGGHTFRARSISCTLSREIEGIPGELLVSHSASFLLNLAALGSCPEDINSGQISTWIAAGYPFWGSTGATAALHMLINLGLFTAKRSIGHIEYGWNPGVVFTLQDER